MTPWRNFFKVGTFFAWPFLPFRTRAARGSSTVLPRMTPPLPPSFAKAVSALFFFLFILTAAAPARARAPLAPLAPPAETFEGRPVRLPPLLWYEKDPETQRRLFMLSLLYWDVADQDS